jgi:hypothetical protein
MESKSRAEALRAELLLWKRRRGLPERPSRPRVDGRDHRLRLDGNLILEGAEVAERLALLFEEDRDRSDTVDLKRLAARGVFERVVDRLAASLLWIV